MSDTPRRVTNETFTKRLNALWHAQSPRPSERAMSRKFGLSQGVFGRWCEGAGDPTMANLAAIADHFGVTMDYLWGRTDDPVGYYTPLDPAVADALAHIDAAREALSGDMRPRREGAPEDAVEDVTADTDRRRRRRRANDRNPS